MINPRSSDVGLWRTPSRNSFGDLKRDWNINFEFTFLKIYEPFAGTPRGFDCSETPFFLCHSRKFLQIILEWLEFRFVLTVMKSEGLCKFNLTLDWSRILAPPLF